MAREIYYAVQKVSTATARNERFAREVHVSIIGKDDKTLFYDTPDGWNNCNLLAPYWVREYGYKRKCDAVRNWTYKHPGIGKPYWDDEVSVVTLWVRKDNTVAVI